MTNQELDSIRNEIEYAYRHDTWARIPPKRTENLLTEIDRLTEIVDAHASSARIIALYLKPYCDENQSYAEMIADASRKAREEIDRLKVERDAVRIPMLQYKNLRRCFNTLVSLVLGDDYYNLAMDVYACDEECCRDIAARCKKQWRGIERGNLESENNDRNTGR